MHLLKNFIQKINNSTMSKINNTNYDNSLCKLSSTLHDGYLMDDFRRTNGENPACLINKLEIFLYLIIVTEHLIWPGGNLIYMQIKSQDFHHFCLSKNCSTITSTGSILKTCWSHGSYFLLEKCFWQFLFVKYIHKSPIHLISTETLYYLHLTNFMV